MVQMLHNCTRKLIATLGLLFATECFTQSESVAQPVTAEDILRLYEQGAFAQKDERLVRFKSQAAYVLNIACFDNSCDNDSNLVARFLPKNSLRVSISHQYSKTAPINLFFYSSIDQLPRDLGFNVAPGAKVSSVGEPDGCTAVTYSYDYEIRQVFIGVSSRLSNRRKLACVLLRVLQGSGFVFKHDIERLLLETPYIETMGDEQFKTIQSGLRRLVAIHFDSNATFGMTLREFETKMRPSTIRLILEDSAH